MPGTQFVLGGAYRDAVERATAETGLADTFPGDDLPYSVADLLAFDPQTASNGEA